MKLKIYIVIVLLYSIGFTQTDIKVVKTLTSDMQLPTDIALLSDGRICIADGVNSRVVVYKNNKTRNITFPEMVRPLGLSQDIDGGLLVTDTYNKSVIVIREDLSYNYSIQLPIKVDPTDVLAVGNNNLWIVDNDGHKIFVINRNGSVIKTIGQKGSDGDSFHFPSTISLHKNNEVIICDVLNGRIQIFSSNGEYIGQLSNWGITPSTLYRPKGVAGNSLGDIAVTDSFTGVIHLFKSFNNNGTILTYEGNNFILKNPTGIVWENENSLWVVESGSGSVYKIEITK